MAKNETKAWYDDIDAATLQRIKTYSAFNDATSKNLMVQTMYEYREKEIQDFKETNHELAETCIERKKRIAELEEKISVLLSCKNCPDNKGGLICQKEYEDKCLSQKIQYIKELKEENAELKKRNGELAGQRANLNRWLGEAKVALRNVIDYLGQFCSDYPDCVIKAEYFLQEV